MNKKNVLQKKSSAKAIQDALGNAIRQPLPVRGWEVELIVEKRPVSPFVLYASPPKVVSEGRGIDKTNVPKIEATVAAQDMLVRAKFCFSEKVRLVFYTPGPNGQKLARHIEMNEEILREQKLKLNFPNECLCVDIDASKVPTVDDPHGGIIVPQPQSWQDLTEFWALKKKDAGGTTEERKAQYILGQLAQIRENGLSQMMQSLGRTASQVKKTIPDFFGLTELFLFRKPPGEAVLKMIPEGACQFTLYNPPPAETVN